MLHKDAVSGLPSDRDHLSHYRRRRRPAWLFELAGGAIADFDDTCVPKEKREAVFTIAALHQWPMGVDEPRCVEAAEDVRVSTPLILPFALRLTMCRSGSRVRWPP